jgi:hypothetical protein
LKNNLILLSIFFFNILNADLSIIKSFNLYSKKNGIIAEFNVNSINEIKNISGWQAKSGWFYITLYGYDGDTAKIRPQTLPKEIHKLQIIKVDKSIQLGIKLPNRIEYFNIEPDYNKSTIYTSLYYKNEILTKVIENQSFKYPLSRINKLIGLKKWLYTTGLGLTISGISNKQQNIKRTQTGIGLGIIVLTSTLDFIGIF